MFLPFRPADGVGTKGKGAFCQYSAGTSGTSKLRSILLMVNEVLQTAIAQKSFFVSTRRKSFTIHSAHYFPYAP